MPSKEEIGLLFFMPCQGSTVVPRRDLQNWLQPTFWDVRVELTQLQGHHASTESSLVGMECRVSAE
jgi:hypothetical protein